jgi:DNA-binding SARP family transcriptional activator
LRDDRHGRRTSRNGVLAAGSGAIVPAKVRVPSADALPRERLETRLAAAIKRHRLILVIAPAGSGKSTLLSRFAAASDVPVAWYRAESWDQDEARLLRHLEVALSAALPGLATGWAGIEEAAAALDAWHGSEAVLVIDDLHALEGSAAEAALSRLVDYAPPWLRIVAASRAAPDFNLSRLRVSGDLLEIEGDDLRFRAWEVERLFRDFYQSPVPPGELAVLAQRTEGWAAGLQLFHLATRGKSADERRRILGGVGSSTRLVREYLARNVLAELPDDLRAFLVGTCVLGRLSGDLCDQLLDRRGSGQVLDELARRQIFTVAIDDADGTYRYHEVLRAHLDRMLVEEVGEEEARRRHQRAGALLEAAGALSEALVAYSRAEDWPAVRLLLGDRGEQVTGGTDLHLELLPPALVRNNPWLALASARRARAEGRWAAALEAYSRAETAFAASSTGLVCRRERLALAAWLDPVAIPPLDWTGLLRTGLVREPLRAARDGAQADDAHRQFVRGLLHLAAGEVVVARGILSDASQQEDLDPGLATAAAMAAALAGVLSEDARAAMELEAAIDTAERCGLPWLARIGRTAARVAGRRAIDAPAADEVFAIEGDAWGAAFTFLAEAWSPLPGVRSAAVHRNGSGNGTASPEVITGIEIVAGPEARVAAADRAAALFRRLGSGVLEALARGLAAYGHAEAGTAEAREAALGAESLARATGTAGPRLLAYAALASADPARANEYELLAAAVRRETGLALPPPAIAEASPAVEAIEAAGEAAARADVGDRVRIRTFGGFAVEVDGRTVSFDGVKPRARAVLRLLALHAGAGVHREVIQEALWQDADGQAGGRSLHVAVSGLRGRLVEVLGPEGSRVIAREGDTYRLKVDRAAVDVGRFEQLMGLGRASRARGESAVEAFSAAIDLYRGDLLPQDGPAEWALDPREHSRHEVVEAATWVAEQALLDGDPQTAIEVCQRGLEIDRFHDPLWRILIAARDQAGDPGAAGRDRLEYEAVLAGLGVGSEVSLTSA